MQGSVESTLAQIRYTFSPGKKFGKSGKFGKNIVTTCSEVLSLVNEKDQQLFVKIFNKVIYKTNKYFLSLPLKLRCYYCHFFYNEMLQYIEKHLDKNLENKTIKSYLICLYKAYARENIVKDWNKYREKNWFMNPNYPYDVK